MPRANEALRAEWPGHSVAITFLQNGGYALRKDWTWAPPTPEYVPTEREVSAMRYLIDEWDFGGLTAA